MDARYFRTSALAIVVASLMVAPLTAQQSPGSWTPPSARPHEAVDG